MADKIMIDKQVLDEKIESLVLEFVLKHKVGYKASVISALIKQDGVITNCHSKIESIIAL